MLLHCRMGSFIVLILYLRGWSNTLSSNLRSVKEISSFDMSSNLEEFDGHVSSGHPAVVEYRLISVVFQLYARLFHKIVFVTSPSVHH